MRSSVHVAAFLRLAEMQGVGQGIEKGHMNFHLLFGWGILLPNSRLAASPSQLGRMEECLMNAPNSQN